MGVGFYHWLEFSYDEKGNKEIRYNTMDFRGILTVTDSDQFANTLMQGLGKAKAFGCGLMLIRRA